MSNATLPPIGSLEPPEIRTGIGYDSHRLVEGRKLILGGVEIPADKGLDGHSDADILLHSITDAMLGAAALGDIGELFPAGDPQWHDAESSIFVKHAVELLESYGWKLVNVDVVIVIERPKLLPHRDRIRESVAGMLGLEAGAVGLKAKTGEGVGPIGAGVMAEAHAAVLIARSKDPQVM